MASLREVLWKVGVSQLNAYIRALGLALFARNSLNEYLKKGQVPAEQIAAAKGFVDQADQYSAASGK